MGRSKSIALSTAAVMALALMPTATAVAQDDGEPFKLGMAIGGETANTWQKAQGDVARALAEQRGWDYIELSNEADAATAVNNARIFVQEGADAVIGFNGTPSSYEAIVQILGGADIPYVTYDIAGEGMYFVGADNLAAGIAGGEALGEIINERWNCEPDLVISAKAEDGGIVDEYRTGGMRTGVANICPDIPAEKYVEFESQGSAAEGLPAARDLLAANPDAVRMAVVGINDSSVLGLIQAAEQLGRAEEVIAWGQDGAFITGDNVNPALLGSVLYFLESYAVNALRDVIDPIAAGEEVPMRDTPDDPASLVQPCPVSAEEAAAVPTEAERVEQLIAAPPGTTAYDLFCPAA